MNKEKAHKSVSMDSFRDARLLKEFSDFILISESLQICVYEAFSVQTGTKHVIKKVRRQTHSASELRNWSIECLFKEILYASRGSAVHCLPCNSFGLDLINQEVWYATPYLISLRTILRSRSNNAESHTGIDLTPCKLIRQICSTLQHFKEQEQVSHNNIKPENIFYDQQTDRFVLGDWANNIKSSGNRDPDSQNQSSCGSYLAPELVTLEHECLSSNFSFYGADIYSLGLVCLEVLGVRKDAFWALNRIKNCAFYIKCVNGILADLRSQSIDEMILELVRKMLSMDAFSRPSCGEILKTLGGGKPATSEQTLAECNISPIRGLRSVDEELPLLRWQSSSGSPVKFPSDQRFKTHSEHPSFASQLLAIRDDRDYNYNNGLRARLNKMVEECDRLRRALVEHEVNLETLNEERTILKVMLSDIQSSSSVSVSRVTSPPKKSTLNWMDTSNRAKKPIFGQSLLRKELDMDDIPGRPSFTIDDPHNPIWDIVEERRGSKIEVLSKSQPIVSHSITTRAHKKMPG